VTHCWRTTSRCMSGRPESPRRFRGHGRVGALERARVSGRAFASAILMRLPPPRATRAPGCSARGTQRRALAHMALPCDSHPRALRAHFAIKRTLAVVPSPLCAARLVGLRLEQMRRVGDL
jgi:hypothetical protein